MTFVQGTFTRTYTAKLRVADTLGMLAGVLLILSPLINPHVTVGVGFAFLLWVAFRKVVRTIRKRESN